MRNSAFSYNLKPFADHIVFSGVTPATAAVYVSRVKRILTDLKLESADEEYLAIPGRVTEKALREVIGEFSGSSQSQILSAWRAFVSFTALNLPKLEQRGTLTRGPLPALTDLHPTALPVWDLFRQNPGLAPMLVVSLKWRHLEWKGPPEPAKAFGVSVQDRNLSYSWQPPLTAFLGLWNWARGPWDYPSPDQPLVPQDQPSPVPGEERKGWDPISVDAILEIFRAGKVGRIPWLVAKDVNAGAAARAAMPRPPAFGGGNDDTPKSAAKKGGKKK